MLIVQVFHEESLLSITYNCNKLQPFQLELSVAGSCPGQEQPLLSPQSQEMWSQCFSCLVCLCKRLFVFKYSSQEGRSPTTGPQDPLTVCKAALPTWLQIPARIRVAGEASAFPLPRWVCSSLPNSRQTQFYRYICPVLLCQNNDEWQIYKSMHLAPSSHKESL